MANECQRQSFWCPRRYAIPAPNAQARLTRDSTILYCCGKKQSDYEKKQAMTRGEHQSRR